MEVAIRTTSFEMSDYLDSPEMIAEYIRAAVEEGDEEQLLAAIGDVVRAKGVSEVSSRIGVNRQNLYRALQENGNPRWVTITSVLKDLGLKLTVETV